MMAKSILLVTLTGDIHGLAVQAAIRRRGAACHIIESDQISSRESINYSVSTGGKEAGVYRTSDNELIDVSEIDVIWWRRFGSHQRIESDGLDQAHRSLIDNDCAGALAGSLHNLFRGWWVSSPKATIYASNKLHQLAAASRCGWRIPDTVVTQSPSVVQNFYARHGGRVIIKPVAGTPGPLLFTQYLREEHFSCIDSICASPAMYQEYIPGSRHIRLNCFGSQSYAGLIDSPHLDWRPDLNVPISTWTVPSSIHAAVRTVLDRLGLEMGIIDIKETPNGDYVWLEVNPQGQFLFLEGITGQPLTELFTDYLLAH
jgi:glutathione synthase/RimK-type ligase-like ATP-grasp enzyme